MKKFLLTLTAIIVVLFAFGILNATAATYGELNYIIENGEVAVSTFNKDISSVTIPSSVDGYPVTSIRSFGNCKNLTSVEIPDSVVRIEKYAFEYCSSLTSVNIPDSVKIIDKNAFNGCSSLTQVSIPDSVINIGDYAFSGCSSLKSVKIPNSVSSIGVSTFSGCSALTNVEIPDSVTNIGQSAFKGCISLESIDIGDVVTYIDYSVFENCKKLESINIPDSVTIIRSYAFLSCDNLKNVYYEGNEEQWNKIRAGYDNEVLLNSNIVFNYNPITVTYNGEKIRFDQEPVIDSGRTLVPLRAIFEKIGAEVVWNGEIQTVTAKKGDITVELTINDMNAKKNGSTISLDVPAKIINGRTLVPVRFVSDCFGVGVEWNEANKQVILTTN